MSAEALYAGVAERLTGQPMRVAEVACAAQGAPHCMFAFYK
jgi:predicted hydrocarbon binding protein